MTSLLARVDAEHVAASLDAIRNALFDEDAAVTCTILAKILANVLKKPNSMKVRTIRKGNEKIAKCIVNVPGAVEVLRAAGFRDTKDGDALRFAPGDDEDGDLNCAKKIASVFQAIRSLAIDGLRVSPASLPEIPGTLPSTFARSASTSAPGIHFDAFSAKVDRVAAQPRGAAYVSSQTEQRVQALQSKHNALVEKAGIPDRRLRARSIKSIRSSSTRTMQEPESTKSDFAVVAKSVKAKLRKAKDESKFQTKAMRDLKQLRSKRVYTEACIRVQFPPPHNTFILESFYNPSEQVQDVMSVVTSSLAPLFASFQFKLYVSPPRRVLKPAASLSDEGLVPGAMVYLSWCDTSALPPSDNALDVLRPELAAAFSRPSDAAAFPSSIPLDPKAAAKTERATSRSKGSSSSTKKSKKPKWFKL